MDLEPLPKKNPRTTYHQDKWKNVSKNRKAKTEFMKQVLQPNIGPKYPTKRIPIQDD